MKRICLTSMFLFLLFFPLAGALPGQPGNSALKPEAGFITIDPVTFYFHFGSYFHRLEMTSSEARLWYSFHPADEQAGEKPVFIFFNGGPGAATSSGLWSMGTGPKTLDYDLEQGGETYVDNPVSWTRMGNLLYVDARITGFSYNLMDDPWETLDRYREFDAQNFNMYLDAADFIRLLLKFLADHPVLQDNPVVVVGESYGGARASCMLHLLLNYKDYANGVEVYQDKDLSAKIQAHLESVFPAYKDQTVPAGVIARQFGRQILIQPVVSYLYQRDISGEIFEREDSIIFEIAREEGVEYVPCRLRPPGQSCDPCGNAQAFLDEVAGRDLYYYPKPAGWTFEAFYTAARLLCFVDNLSLMAAVDVRDITGLYAWDRYRAYKMKYLSQQAAGTQELTDYCEPSIVRRRALREISVNSDDPGDLSDVFGTLRRWDKYFIDLSSDVSSAFYWNTATAHGYDIHYSRPYLGRMFLKNLAHVDTFITNADYDLVIYSAAIPGCLEMHEDVVSSVVHDTRGETAENRCGKLRVKYLAQAFPDIPELDTRTIRFPRYTLSGHTVTLFQPGELFEDVAAWLGSATTAGSN